MNDNISRNEPDTEQKSQMFIRIYQIDTSRDKNNICLMRYENLEKFQGTSEIDSSIYNRVFEGEVACKDLEAVYCKFNYEHPQGYSGRSLSVSDIVEIVNENQESEFYFCDSIGFEKVDFEPEKTKQINTISVVLLEPGKVARVVDIDASLEGLQKVVDGYIEPAYFFNEPVCVVVNEEGKVNGLPLNRAVYDEDKQLIDIIAGTAFICGLSEDSFRSLTKEEAKKFVEKFNNPEHFCKINDRIIATPYTPKPNNYER